MVVTKAEMREAERHARKVERDQKAKQKAARTHAMRMAGVLLSVARSCERECAKNGRDTSAYRASWCEQLETVIRLADAALDALGVEDTSEAYCKLSLARGDVRALIARLS